MRFLRALILLSLCLVFGRAAASEVAVIDLKYSSAEQLIPVIRPLLATGGGVSGMGNQLVLRTSRENLRELKKVVESLDRMPRRLMIYVRQDLETENAQREAELTGSAGSDAGQTAAARIYESRGASRDGSNQQIQVLEGSPAYIQVGKSIAVRSRTLMPTLNGPVVTDSVDYRDLNTGFEVVPRVQGERVFLEISAQRDTPRGKRGSADLQRAASSVSARLGEWFELGGASRDDTRSDAGVLLGAAGLHKDVRHVWVKVEELE